MTPALLVEFIKVLRGSGVSVSPAETLDALRAAEQLGVADRARLRDGLALVLAKSQEDKQRFYQSFDAFFHFTAPKSDAATRGSDSDDTNQLMPPPGEGGGDSGGGGSQGQSSEGSAGEAPDGGNEPALAELLLNNDSASLALRMARASRAVKLSQIRVITQKGLYARRIMQRMGLEQLDQEILALEQQATRPASKRARRLRDARTRLREDVIDQVNRQFLLHARETSEKLREETMRSVNLRDLHEFRQVHRLVEKMARRLVSVHGRRQRRARRGQLDARRTLGASVRHDGVPARLYWRRRKLQRARVVVICDVSGSVAAVSRFLLMFLYAVSEVLPRLRSFVFSSQLNEVSELFERYEGHQAVLEILDRYAGRGTDYGVMLEQFSALMAGQIDKQTTVIILGDARNNELPARQDLLAEIALRSRQVLWLNPERENRWGSGDSVMPLYRPYCRRAMVCRNLAELERFVDTLLGSLR